MSRLPVSLDAVSPFPSRSTTGIHVKQFFPQDLNAKLTNLTTVSNQHRYNDISISPWMYVMAFCTENGEVFSTRMMKHGEAGMRRLDSYPVYRVRLGDLHSQTASVEPTQKKKSTQPPNFLVNQTVDLKYSIEDFTRRYCLVFDDKDFSVAGKVKPATGNGGPNSWLTKHDLHHLYAVTHVRTDGLVPETAKLTVLCVQVAWNPNVAAYSWLMTATKSGLCRINWVDVNDPRKM